MPKPKIKVLGFDFLIDLLTGASYQHRPWEVAGTLQAVGFLLVTRETEAEFLAPSFSPGLVPSIVHLWEMNQKTEVLHLCAPFSVSVHVSLPTSDYLAAA